MKSIIFLAILTIGIASCETPQPATGTNDTTDSSGMGTGSGTMSGTDTASGSMGSDTSTTKRDSLPQ